MKFLGLTITSMYLVMVSYSFGDSLNFLNKKHSILGYEKLEFYYQCTNGNETTYTQKMCFSMELDLWEKVLADIGEFVNMNGFGSDTLLSTKQYWVSQEAWKAFVVADCLMQTDAYKGGSFAQVVQFSCPAEKAKARVHELMGIIH